MDRHRCRATQRGAGPRSVLVLLLALTLLGACSATPSRARPGTGASNRTASTTTARTEPTPRSGPKIVTVAGDLGDARKEIQPIATLITSMNPDWVVLVGDLVYPNGTPFDTWFNDVYGPMKPKTVPTPGNHDYHQPDAKDYYQYFQLPPYYAKDLGNHWRAYSLNCEIACTAGSLQEQWLKNDLAQHPGLHYLAFDHRPRYTSPSTHRDDEDLSAIWADLQAAGADIFLAGHNHNAERFARMDGTGNVDPNGLRSFVVGNGGHGLYPFTGTHVGSEWKDDTNYGVLRLALDANSYSWQFVAAGGHVLDAGTDRTHNRTSPGGR